MEGRNSVTVPNDTVINNNNDNEVMKRNQEALGLDDKIPRKKFKSEVVKRKESVKNANAKRVTAKNIDDANENLSVSIISTEVNFRWHRK